MRSAVVAVAAFILAASSGGAQGFVVPRPCPVPMPPPCRPDRPCPPMRRPPCPPIGNAVVRAGSDVRVTLSDRVLRYEVDETFVNRGGGLGEADYFFPLPKGAAFQDLKLSINGELVAGELLDANQARGIYEEIVRRQRDPALVEWMGSGLLRARIFPIAPGERKHVVVRFQSVAQREGDALRVDYVRGSAPSAPPAVRPMASPVDDRVPFDDENDDVRFVSRRGSGTTFVFTYPNSAEYGEAYSPTHRLRRTASGGTRTVRVLGEAGDVTVLVPIRRPNVAAISVLAYAPGNEDGFALVTIAPPLAGAETTTPRDVTFVVDVSGSMSGRKIEQARAAGKRILATLSPRDRFRVIDFSTDVRTFRDEPVYATPANVRAAARYLDALDAEGSTNISGALAEALRGPAEPGRLPVVLFLTDGAPTVGERDPGAIADSAARGRGRRRIFTFGVGADVNVSLIEQLALQGRGTAQFVRPEESVERAVSVVAGRLRDPVATDVVVRIECQDDGAPARACVRFRRTHPSGPIDVFAGQDVVLLTRYRASGRTRLSVEGRGPQGPVRWTSVVNFPARERANAFVARLWAAQRLGYLSAEKRRDGGSPEADAEIRELGERYGIPTEFSSYLVQEPSVVAQNRAVPLDRAVTTGAGVARRQRSEGAAAPAAPAAAFDAAKRASELRDATTLAAAESATEIGDAGVTRRVEERIFTSIDGVWTDARHEEGRATVTVKAYSAAYFELLSMLPELRASLALGDRVIVAGRDVEVRVMPSGVDQLTEEHRILLREKWT